MATRHGDLHLSPPVTRPNAAGHEWLPRMVLVTLSANHVVCDCGWRPELGKHYRINR